MTRYPTLDDLVMMTVELGGLHVHDVGLLDSAANRPAVTVWGEDAYPDIHTKAALLLEPIAPEPPAARRQQTPVVGGDGGLLRSQRLSARRTRRRRL